jgi:hypothetical protein
MRHARHVLATAVLVLSLVFVIGVDYVSAAPTIYGTLRGQVVDEQDSPLSGVTIIARSESQIREMAVMTDAEGVFFIPGLAPGEYAVVARMTGFIPMQQNTRVQVDEVTMLIFKLSLGELTETVVVTADKPLVDKSEVEAAYNLRKDFTETLPTPRSYQSLLQLAPGVNNTGEGSGNPNIGGGTRNSNNYLVDGVSITDAVTGTFGQNLNFDAIEEYDIKLSGVSAEYGAFQGGLANVITKSGGNEFTGSLRSEITSASFEAVYKESTQDEFAPEEDGYTRPSIPGRSPRDLSNAVETTLGGPIVRNNAWFFISYERNDNQSLQQLTNPTGGPFGNGTYVRVFEGDNSNGKLTWQITNEHKLQYNYAEDPAQVPRCYGQLFWGGPCYDTPFVDYQRQGGHTWVTSWNAVWTNKFFTDFRMTHWENGFSISPFAPQTIRPDLIFESPSGELGAGLDAGHAPTIDLTTGVLFDAQIFGDFPETRERDQYEGKVTAFLPTSNMGTHTLKIGADYMEQTRVGSSVLAGNGLIYTLGFVEPPPGLGGNGDPYDVNNRIYYLFIDFAEPSTAAPVTKETAFYVQDDWTLNDKWSFNLGLRYENFQEENDVGEGVIDQSAFAPRLGATFDIGGNGRNLVKASASRYNAPIRLTTLSPFVRAAGGQSASDVYLNISGGPGPPDWFLLSRTRPDPGTSGFAPDLSPQYIDELTIGYERALSANWGVKARYVDRTWDDIIGQEFTYDYDTDGIATQILYMTNKDNIERSYSAFIVEVEKRYSNNWTMRGSIVKSKAEGNTATDTGFATYDAFEGVPQSTENQFGRLAFDVDTAIKLFGSYNIPLPSKRHKLEVGGIFDWAAGNRYSGTQQVTVVVGPGFDGVQDVPLGSSDAGGSDDQTDQLTQFFNPRGTFQEPDVWFFNFQTRYQFLLSKKVTFEGRMEFRNLFNEQTPIAVNTNYNADGTAPHTFGYPTGYGQFQRPRSYRFNVAIIW